MFKRIKEAINRFLENIAKENKELYGSGRMDCCNLNKTTNKQKPQKYTKKIKILMYLPALFWEQYGEISYWR